MKLNELRDNPGANVGPKRVGRGIGSGMGKQAGKGTKGQKSRSGVSLLGFEGGQMPLHRRLPKRGFKNIFRPDYAEVNLGRLQKAVDAGLLDIGALVNESALRAAGVIKGPADGVRLLAKGAVTSGVNIEVTGASKAAIAAVEKAGGTVVLLPKKAEPESHGRGGARRAAAAKARADKAARLAAEREKAKEAASAPAEPVAKKAPKAEGGDQKKGGKSKKQ